MDEHLPPVHSLIRRFAQYYLQVFLYSLAVGVGKGRARDLIVGRNSSQQLQADRFQTAAVLFHQCFKQRVVGHIHKLVVPVYPEQPEPSRSLKHFSVFGVLGEGDSFLHDGQHGDVSVDHGDLPSEEDLRVVPDVHDGKVLSLEFEHSHSCFFDLPHQFVLQKLHAFSEGGQVLATELDQL